MCSKFYLSYLGFYADGFAASNNPGLLKPEVEMTCSIALLWPRLAAHPPDIPPLELVMESDLVLFMHN